MELFILKTNTLKNWWLLLFFQIIYFVILISYFTYLKMEKIKFD